jgi:hypothetical protein
MSDPSPIPPETLSWFSRLSNRHKFLVISCAIVGGYLLIIQVESQDSLTCDYVDVLGTVSCGRSQCFLVRYMATGDKRKVGTFVDKPFGVAYTGGAALFAHQGKWTRAYHFEFGDNCPSPSNIVGGDRKVGSTAADGGRHCAPPALGGPRCPAPQLHR